MRKLYTLITGAVLLFFYQNVKGQDIHFSQFWMAPLVQNPALSGSDEDIRAIINYRDQWRSIGTPYKTLNFSIDMALSKITNKSGFWAGGIQVFSDQAGESEMNTLQANLSLAYHVYVGEFSTLSGGLSGGYSSRNLNYNNLKWGSQFDGYAYNSTLPPGEPAENTKVRYADLGGGVSWNFNKGDKYMSGNDHRKASLGIAVFHPHQPDYSFYESGEKLNMKMIAHGDILVGIPNTNFAIVPGFIYYNQGKLSQINAGAMFRYVMKQQANNSDFEKGSALSLGAHFRAEDAFIASLLLELGNFDIGFSYDFNVSQLENASSGRGGMEFALRYFVQNPLRKVKGKEAGIN